MSSDTGLPDPSTRPRFVRYVEDCAICWSESTGAFALPRVLPTKFAKGTAGMYWPNVPLPVTLNVRDDANVTKLERPFTAALDVALEACVSGRISSVPIVLAVAVPNQPFRT